MPDKDDAGAPDDKVYLWPQNEPLWWLWLHLQTQWRTNAGGARDGLDYAAVGYYMREVWRVKRREFAPTFGCIQAMERACLEAWASQRDK